MTEHLKLKILRFAENQNVGVYWGALELFRYIYNQNRIFESYTTATLISNCNELCTPEFGSFLVKKNETKANGKRDHNPPKYKLVRRCNVASRGLNPDTCPCRFLDGTVCATNEEIVLKESGSIEGNIQESEEPNWENMAKRLEIEHNRVMATEAIEKRKAKDKQRRKKEITDSISAWSEVVNNNGNSKSSKGTTARRKTNTKSVKSSSCAEYYREFRGWNGSMPQQRGTIGCPIDLTQDSSDEDEKKSNVISEDKNSIKNIGIYSIESFQINDNTDSIAEEKCDKKISQEIDCLNQDDNSLYLSFLEEKDPAEMVRSLPGLDRSTSGHISSPYGIDDLLSLSSGLPDLVDDSNSEVSFNTANGSVCGEFKDDVNNEFHIEASPSVSSVGTSDLDFISENDDGCDIHEFSVDYDNKSEETVSKLSLHSIIEGKRRHKKNPLYYNDDIITDFDSFTPVSSVTEDELQINTPINDSSFSEASETNVEEVVQSVEDANVSALSEESVVEEEIIDDDDCDRTVVYKY